MAEKLFGFECDVAEYGYMWISEWPDAEVYPPINAGEQLLVRRDWRQTVGMFGSSPYEPLTDYPALFQTFADVAPDPEAIALFANRFGPLVNGWKVEPRESGFRTNADTLRFWLTEICVMKDAVQMWDAVRARDPDALRAIATKYIEWWEPGPSGEGRPMPGDRQPMEPEMACDLSLRPGKDGAAVTFAIPHCDYPGRGDRTQTSSDLQDPFLYRAPTGEFHQPAMHWLLLCINTRLAPNASPKMDWSRPREGSKAVDSKPGLQIVPHNLLGALWLQLARAIDGNKDYRRCQECGAWFELHPDLARTNRQYCSQACRFKAYRVRQAEAKRLYGEGTEIEVIADTLDTDVETARGWINKPPRHNKPRKGTR